MNDLLVAYPDGRIGKSVKPYFENRFGSVPDIDDRNRFQRSSKYRFMIAKARDVPRAIDEGCFFGVTGRDFLEEYGNPEIGVVERLPVCKSKLVVFGKPSGFPFPKIVTVYPRLAKRYFDETLEPYELLNLSGETESWVASRRADKGVDVIETGETLENTGLVVTDVIMESSAIIIARKSNIDIVRGLYEISTC